MPVKQKYAEEELVSFLKDGSEQSFSIIYDSYSGALFSVISTIIKDRDEATDLLQETFVKVWNNRASYDSSKARLYTWLLNVARNTAIDATRSKQFKNNNKNQNIDDSVRLVNRSHNLNASYDAIGLKEVVDKLKSDYKAVLDLLYFNGFTHEEAAKELNIPLGTIKTRCRNALIELRELLNVKIA